MPHLEQHVNLKPYNTFGVQANAHSFVKIHSDTELVALLTAPTLKNLPKLVLGEGSNILFTQNYPGLIIKNEIKGIEKIAENEEFVFVKIGAGENWHRFVLHNIEQGWGGTENLSLIPGTVGAAPVQNIGAYGVELCQLFHELSAVNMADGSVRTFNVKDCEFGYRDSIFKTRYKNQYVITDVTLKLQKKPSFNISYYGLQDTLDAMHVTTLSIKAISDAVIKLRQTKLPNPQVIGNAGSFFKNPLVSKTQFLMLKEKYSNMPYFSDSNPDLVKIPAGWLIEQCGWKGKRIGHIGVYEKQALVLVNYGMGTGSDIENLAYQIQASVHEKFGVLLTPEVNIF